MNEKGERMATMEQRTPSHLSSRAVGGLLLFMLCLLAVLMWLQTGWQTGYQGDAWFFYLNASQTVSFGTPTRPFLPLASVLGYGLAPNTLIGFNLIMALMLIARSLLTYVLALQWRAPLPVAFTAALLAMVWPSDTGVYYLGALGVYLPTLLALTALVLMNEYWFRPRLLTLLGMWLALIFSLGGYEANVPIILFAPGFLLVQGARFDRKFRSFVIRWYLFPLLWAAYYVAMLLFIPQSVSYQTSLLAQNTINDLLRSLFMIYGRNLLPMWVSDYGGGSALTWIIAFTFGGILLSVSAYIARPSIFINEDVIQPLVRLVLSGLLIIGLSIAVFVPTSVIHSTIRVYFMATVGGALTISAGLYLISNVLLRERGAAALFSISISLLSSLALAVSLQQHDRYAAQSEAQQAIVYQFAQLFPSFTSGTQVVVVDQTPNAALIERMDGPWHFPYAFHVGMGFTPQQVRIEGCSRDRITTDYTYALDQQDICYFSTERVVVNISGLTHIDTSGENLLLVAYDGDEFSIVEEPLEVVGVALQDYNPFTRFDPEASLPEPLFTLFGFERP